MSTRYDELMQRAKPIDLTRALTPAGRKELQATIRAREEARVTPPAAEDRSLEPSTSK